MREQDMSEADRRLISPSDLEKLTALKRHSKQVAWFLEQFGIRVPTRADGTIVLSWNTFEAINAKRLGLSGEPAPKKRILLRSEAIKRGEL